MEMQKLTVHHYAENQADDRRITISPGNITVVSAEIEDVHVRGLALRNVAILFLDGGSLEICVNHSDLTQLEEATGSYSFDYH